MEACWPDHRWWWLISIVKHYPLRPLKTYILIVLYMVAPILSVLIASSIATATGSRLDEGGSHPCIIFGVDIGELLYAMGVAGWFAFVTFPTGLLAILVVIIVRGCRGRKARTP